MQPANDEILVTQPVKFGDVIFLVHNVPAHLAPEEMPKADREGKWFLDAAVYREVHRLVLLEVVRRGLISGDAFKALRSRAKMKAAEVADLFGVSVTTVSHWETGRHAIPAASWAMMAILALGQDAREVLEAVRRPRRPEGDRVDLDLVA